MSMMVVAKPVENWPDSRTWAITLLQPVQVLDDGPDRRLVETAAVFVEPHRHDDAWLDLRRVRHPVEQPVGVARGLGGLVLVVDRPLGAVVPEVRRQGHGAGLARVEAVAGRAVHLRRL